MYAWQRMRLFGIVNLEQWFPGIVNWAVTWIEKKLMIQLTHAPIDTEELLGKVRSARAGAVVLFLGTSREWTGQRQTATLDYECYAEMAQRKLKQLRDQACLRWTLTACAIVHRLGRVDLGESSVAIAVSSPHRREAFDAGQWLIDTLKTDVPIWKRETWTDGTSEWVHPQELS